MTFKLPLYQHLEKLSLLQLATQLTDHHHCMWNRFIRAPISPFVYQQHLVPDRSSTVRTVQMFHVSSKAFKSSCTTFRSEFEQAGYRSGFIINFNLSFLQILSLAFFSNSVQVYQPREQGLSVCLHAYYWGLLCTRGMNMEVTLCCHDLFTDSSHLSHIQPVWIFLSLFIKSLSNHFL